MPTSVDSTPITTPRRSSRPSTPQDSPSPKTRCCRTCGRPRKGHPAKGCPYGPPATTAEELPTTEELADAVEQLHSLHLEADPTPDDSPRCKSRRRSSPMKQSAQRAPPLEALSPLSSELMNGLLAPGILGNELDEDDVHRHLRGIGDRMEKVSTTPRTSPRKSLAREPAVIFSPAKSPPSTRPIASAVSSRVKVETADESPAPRSLARTMSEEEREQFTDALSKASNGKDVTVYVIHKDIVAEAESRARDLGFHAKVLPTGNDASKMKLVLGKDADAVQGGQAVGRVGTLPVAAGAAIFGAAVTLAGLAYS